MTTTNYVKTSLNLPENAVEELREIARQRGTTMADVVRQAIATEQFLHETVKEGGKILIEGKDKGIRQIILR
jgi:predicted DNA-binding protein